MNIQRVFVGAVITTNEELDAMPDGSAIKTMIGGKPSGRTWGKVEGNWWGVALHGPDTPALPALVLYPRPTDAV